MTTPLENFKSKLGIGNPTLKGKGYNYAPFVMQQGQQTPGEQFFDKIKNRVGTGESIYSNNKQENTSRLANDLIQKSAGLQFDEFGKPNVQLTNFKDLIMNGNQSVQERGQNALQAEQAKSAYKNAVQMQDLGQYGFTGSMSVSGTVVPGASSGNIGAQAVAKAVQVMKNGTPYVWGGNSLSKGIDCSGLVQQIYRQLGVSVPRTTYEQAKNGKRVSVSEARPGDLVFYRPGPNGPEHVGLYMGNGRVIHAANSRLGVIESNLTNSNGAPMMIVRPY